MILFIWIRIFLIFVSIFYLVKKKLDSSVVLMKGREECLDSYDEYYRLSEMIFIYEFFFYIMFYFVR